MSNPEFETQVKRRKIYRQGDLILEQIDATQHDLMKYGVIESEKLEIRSETGNSHVMNNIKLYRYSGMQLVLVEKPTPMTHPQHPTIVIDPGIYRIRFVRDWLLDSQRPYD
jgi:hypothetical protein